MDTNYGKTHTAGGGAASVEEKVDAQGASARDSILKDMESHGYGAVIWGENIFGTTDYPLMERDGHEMELRGFRLAAPGQLVAIVALPDSLEVTGVRILSPVDADRVMGTMRHFQDYYDTGGSPEEWEVAADCYRVAIETYKAEKRASQASSWW